MSDENKFKYYAFISYSHKDQKIAKKLQRWIENYHLPAELQKSNPELPKKLSPVFIDESNLIAKTGSLKSALQENLEKSRHLIVICSPNSAQSDYVNDEIEYFIKHSGIEHIIPLIIDGQLHSDDKNLECFPPALLSLSKELEPLGIDIRGHGMHDAFLRVIATMLKLDLDAFFRKVILDQVKKAVIYTVVALLSMIITGTFILYKDKLARDALEEFTLGNMYYTGVEQDYEKAMEYYKKAADNGNVDAQKALESMVSMIDDDD